MVWSGSGRSARAAEERGRCARHHRPDFRGAAGECDPLLAGHERAEDGGARAAQGHPREPEDENRTGKHVSGSALCLAYVCKYDWPLCLRFCAHICQESLEDISYLLRIPQRKPYGSMEGDVKKAMKVN